MAWMTLERIMGSEPDIDRAKIEATTEADIARCMLEDGEDPDSDPVGFVEHLLPTKIRERVGMSQVEFAAALSIPVATLRNWEQGRVLPDPAARALLRIVAHDPDAALAVIARR